MDKVARAEGLVDAPVEDVWAVVGDPRTHPDWWPDVDGVEVEGELVEGGEYLRTEAGGIFAGRKSIWVADRLDHLKEAHYHCTVSGMYAHFSLTSAQDCTFVELETGMLPPNLRWRMMKAFSGPPLRRWVRDTLDALPDAIKSKRQLT